MPVLIGLNGSDVIDYEGTVTSVTPGSYSGGNTVLTLYDNATIVATITLQGITRAIRSIRPPSRRA